jgi:hypothetical protein
MQYLEPVTQKEVEPLIPIVALAESMMEKMNIGLISSTKFLEPDFNPGL